MTSNSKITFPYSVRSCHPSKFTLAKCDIQNKNSNFKLYNNLLQKRLQLTKIQNLNNTNKNSTKGTSSKTKNTKPFSHKKQNKTDLYDTSLTNNPSSNKHTTFYSSFEYKPPTSQKNQQNVNNKKSTNLKKHSFKTIKPQNIQQPPYQQYKPLNSFQQRRIGSIHKNITFNNNTNNNTISINVLTTTDNNINNNKNKKSNKTKRINHNYTKNFYLHTYQYTMPINKKSVSKKAQTCKTLSSLSPLNNNVINVNKNKNDCHHNKNLTMYKEVFGSDYKKNKNVESSKHKKHSSINSKESNNESSGVLGIDEVEDLIHYFNMSDIHKEDNKLFNSASKEQYEKNGRASVYIKYFGLMLNNNNISNDINKIHNNGAATKQHHQSKNAFISLLKMRKCD
jgi:hypothetical protein